jgi:hypothetical protein
MSFAFGGILCPTSNPGIPGIAYADNWLVFLANGNRKASRASKKGHLGNPGCPFFFDKKRPPRGWHDWAAKFGPVGGSVPPVRGSRRKLS